MSSNVKHYYHHHHNTHHYVSSSRSYHSRDYEHEYDYKHHHRSYRRSKHRSRSRSKSKSTTTTSKLKASTKYDNVHINTKYKEQDIQVSQQIRSNGNASTTAIAASTMDNAVERSKRNARAALLVKLENEEKMKKANYNYSCNDNDVIEREDKDVMKLDMDFLNGNENKELKNGNDIIVIKNNNIIDGNDNVQHNNSNNVIVAKSENENEIMASNNVNEGQVEGGGEGECEDEDPLDVYMKSIQKDATMQDYEIVNMMLGATNNNDNDNDDNADNVDTNKIATIEDITNSNTNNNSNADNNDNHTPPIENDDLFLSTLKSLTTDPQPNNTTTTKDIIYQEDTTEYINPSTSSFLTSSTEDQWRKLKSSSERLKDLKQINHSTINYEPFRKNLYIESPEITNLTDHDVALLRKSNSDIKIRGKDIPKPILTWYHCGLNTTITNILTQRQITKPFPIQMQAIPSIMSGRDIIGIAETGSGKTLSYILPLLRHVLDQRPLKDNEGPIALIMVPTRELAVQIYQELRMFTKYLMLNVCCVYGGSAIGNQISELRRGCEIVVATPGRLIEILCLSNGKITNLLRVTFVVIDEADRMLDMGFEPQISRIIANIRPSRQTVMFSATFPKQIETLAKKILTKPLEIVVGQRGQSAKNITQYIEIIPKSKSFIRLIEILDEHINTSTIIFADSQSESIELWKQLYKQGFNCLLVHGGMDQEDRIDAISQFKNEQHHILISTSICARGLDVTHCELVINFRCPNHMEDYIHRIGRTGRAGKPGTAYTFISPDDEDHLASDIMKALELSGQTIPSELSELVRKYRYKKENGETDRYRISGYLGHGYQFTHNESERRVIERKLIGSGYEYDENAIDENEIKDNLMKLYNNTNCNAICVKHTSTRNNGGDNNKMKLISKDDKAKQIAIDVGMNAAKAAIIAGKHEDEILPIVQDAIAKALDDYKPSVSMAKGVENASRIIENWEEKENIKNHIYTCELDINDYPLNARIAGMKKDNIKYISDVNNVDIIIKGVYVEPGKKIQPGQKRLCLFIKGQQQANVNNAYRDLKRQFDENALMYYTNNANYLHKYNII